MHNKENYFGLHLLQLRTQLNEDVSYLKLTEVLFAYIQFDVWKMYGREAGDIYKMFLNQYFSYQRKHL